MAKYLSTQEPGVHIDGEGMYGPTSDRGAIFIRPDDERPLADWVVPLDEPAKAAFRKWDADLKAAAKDKANELSEAQRKVYARGIRMPQIPREVPTEFPCEKCSHTTKPGERFCSHCGADLAPQRKALEEKAAAELEGAEPIPPAVPEKGGRAADKAL